MLFRISYWILRLRLTFNDIGCTTITLFTVYQILQGVKLTPVKSGTAEISKGTSCTR